MTITGSTISGNSGSGLGGGIANFGGNFTGMLTAVNSTISGNTSGSRGGGIHNGSFSTVQLNNVTITNNTSGFGPVGSPGGAGGVSNESVLTLQNTIIAGNRNLGPFGTSPDCGGNASLTSQGYNLIQNPANCPISGDTTGNITGQDPQLGLLGDNGGLTKTHGLAVGSPAIDSGDPSGCTDEAGAVLTSDQRGKPRPEDGDSDGSAVCDIGAYETAPGTTLDGVEPGHAGNVGPVCATIFGNGFADGATVALQKSGQSPIPGTPVKVHESGTVIATAFDLTGRIPGSYDLVVTHPDGSSITRADAFLVESGGAPELWAEIIGPVNVRRGRAARFFFFYGNRGNVDALGVPIQIAVPPGVSLELRFPVAPPPPNPDQVITDWSDFATSVDARPITDYQVVPLIIPIIPAGFTGALELRVIVSDDVTDTWTRIVPMIGTPYARPDGPDADSDVDVDPAYVEPHVANALEYAQRVLQIDQPLDQEFVRQYLTDQFERIVGQGVAAWIDNFGRPSGGGAGSGSGSGGGAEGSAGDPVCADGCSAADGAAAGAANAGIPVPPVRFVPSNCSGDCTSGCRSGRPWPGGRQCSCPWNINLRFSLDPNEKVGGTMGSGFISGDEPLRYAIYFENDPVLASAPAQEVVITDQLDAAKLDLDTFSLGPISFGDKQVFPIYGVKEFETDVDLRPEQNLLVRIRATLDAATGIVTWRFTSLDPVTLEPPEDALAGFLPPNLNPPEGDGSVAFTVKYKSDLQSGAKICNDAEIFFDVNAPIRTPEWCNTLDDDDPVSAVTALPAVQTTADFPVAWSGSDVGSGIVEYDVFVSVDGGPFALFVGGTTATSATFSGTAGRTYAFYSIARDDASNVEEVPAAADATTQVNRPPVASCRDVTVNTDPGMCSVASASVDNGSSDPEGGVTVTQSPAGPYAAGANLVTLTVTDSAGETSQCTATVTVVDPDAPTITETISGALGQNGWYVGNVNVSWEVGDQCPITQQGCGPSLIDTDTAGQTLICEATSAGGTTSKSVTVKRDTTAPTLSLAVVAGTLGDNGWYVGDVTVRTSGTDSASGIASCTADQFLTTDSAGTVFNGACTDQAGNSTDAQPLTVKRDATAPDTSGSASVSSTQATVTLTANDAVSGVAETRYSVDGGATQVYTGPFVLTGAGVYTIEFFSTDVAGNVETAKTLDVAITPSVDACISTNVLDNFNRANGSLGSNWRGLTGTGFYRIAGNRVDVQAGGPVYWNTALGTSQSAFATLGTIDTKSPSLGVLLKVQSGSVPNAGAIAVVYDAVAGAVRVSTLRLGALAWTHYANTPVTVNNGDKLGACAKTNGEVRVYRNDTLVKTATLNTADQTFFNSKGGKIGVWSVLAPGAFFDDFGGATVSP